MCQKRTRKYNRAPRVHVHLVEPTVNLQVNPEKVAQNRLIQNLAWKTLLLMRKNRLIQEKIVALQKETSQFVSAIMSNPENKQRYLEYVRLYNAGQLALIKRELQRDATVQTEPE
ncbi:unnamed protein product [Leptidea sinapis]|uniref:Uncharacterized protein n=1 Tax=Leptidea sinapis TaxID=189913 RepID=A0A5E4QA47_9NEOP|nr:unnamed protein product [Leptidea sinapis]